MLATKLPIILLSLLAFTSAQDQILSDAEASAAPTGNTSTRAPAEATSAAESVASRAFSSALESAASSISQRAETAGPSETATGAAAPTMDAHIAAMIGGGVAVAAGWFV